ncbi:MAG TPA: VOC family protein [Candidatus Limnocylindrales bacterium]|nr:VOC family protein [Candidatus Limnocylindrales bacterium]
MKSTSTPSPKDMVRFSASTNLAVHVTDLEKAENFYGRVLGFKLLKRNSERLVYDAGDITLYVVKDDKTIPFIPALEVDDYDRAKQYLVKNGCRIIKEWPGERAFYFEDPFGVIIDIVQK